MLLAIIICVLASGCGETSSPTRKKKKIVIIKKRPTDYSDTDDSFDDYGFDDYGYISDRPLAVKSDASSKKDVRDPEYSVQAVDFSLTEDYTVVYPQENTQLRESAKKLASYFSENGISLNVKPDSVSETDKEVLVGNTNRKKSSLADNEFAVSVTVKKLFFESGNFNGVVKAIAWFVSLEYKSGKINTLKGKYDFVSKLNRADGLYEFVWGDEFDGNALDDSKWEFSAAIGTESSFKLSRDAKAVNVSDGLLKLSVLRWFDPDNNQIQAIVPYTVEGKRHMNFRYGYLEMRARFPFGGGAWPSLWLSGACGTNSGAVVSSLFNNGDILPANFSAEIDIVEYTSLQPNLHKWFYEDLPGIENKHSSLGDVTKLVRSDLGLDINQNYVYQTVGFEWTPEKMTVYLNGKEYFTYSWKESTQLDQYNDMTDFLNPLFIRINNHLKPENIPSDYSSLPCEYFVDYIRLYQKSDTGGLWLAE